jgi:hypothetical protein
LISGRNRHEDVHDQRLSVSSGSGADLVDRRGNHTYTEQDGTCVQSQLTEREAGNLCVDKHTVLHHVVLDLNGSPGHISVINGVSTNPRQGLGQGVSGFGTEHDAGQDC